MQIGTSGSHGKVMKCSTFGLRRWKVKVTWYQNRSQKSISAKSVQIYPTNFSQTWQAHITINANSITTAGIQKIKGLVHTRPKIDLKAWWKHHSRLLFGLSSFPSLNMLSSVLLTVLWCTLLVHIHMTGINVIINWLNDSCYLHVLVAVEAAWS